jgi:hypothetical protein
MSLISPENIRIDNSHDDTILSLVLLVSVQVESAALIFDLITPTLP